MGIKFYLNKFAKVDNIEGYTLNTVMALHKEYTDFLEKSGGTDPDFPGMEFGGGGKKVNGRPASEADNNDKE